MRASYLLRLLGLGHGYDEQSALDPVSSLVVAGNQRLNDILAKALTLQDDGAISGNTME